MNLDFNKIGSLNASMIGGAAKAGNDPLKVNKRESAPTPQSVDKTRLSREARKEADGAKTSGVSRRSKNKKSGERSGRLKVLKSALFSTHENQDPRQDAPKLETPLPAAQMDTYAGKAPQSKSGNKADETPKNYLSEIKGKLYSPERTKPEKPVSGAKKLHKQREEKKLAEGGAIFARADKILSEADPNMSSTRKKEYLTAAARAVAAGDREALQNLDLNIALAGPKALKVRAQVASMQKIPPKVTQKIVDELQGMNPRLNASDMKNILLSLAELSGRKNSGRKA